MIYSVLKILMEEAVTACAMKKSKACIHPWAMIGCRAAVAANDCLAYPSSRLS